MVFSRSFCVGDTTLLHWFQKINCSFHARLPDETHWRPPSSFCVPSAICQPYLLILYSHSALSTSHSTLYIPHFTLYTPHSTLYTPHFTLHTTLYTPHSTLHTPHSTLYTPHSTLYTPHFTLHTLHFTLHTLHFTLHTSNSTLYTVHSTLCRTLHPTSPCEFSENVGMNNFIVINLEMLTLFLKIHL